MEFTETILLLVASIVICEVTDAGSKDSTGTAHSGIAGVKSIAISAPTAIFDRKHMYQFLSNPITGPLVRVGKRTISASSVILHCQKYHFTLRKARCCKPPLPCPHCPRTVWARIGLISHHRTHPVPGMNNS